MNEVRQVALLLFVVGFQKYLDDVHQLIASFWEVWATFLFVLVVQTFEFCQEQLPRHGEGCNVSSRAHTMTVHMDLRVEEIAKFHFEGKQIMEVMQTLQQIISITVIAST